MLIWFTDAIDTPDKIVGADGTLTLFVGASTSVLAGVGPSGGHARSAERPPCRRLSGALDSGTPFSKARAKPPVGFESRDADQ